ncbi:MAG: PD-(D/E)XK nuclease family protein, partial [Winogradskyella sp.]|nr:PD-(D/E)XK nuclease family protein [Winogradskyella sp.]
MTTFIEDVLKDLQKSGISVEDRLFVVPSKRAAIFIKYHLAKVLQHTSFVPRIISIEDFVKDLSGLKLISSTEQLFTFYSSYKKITPSDKLESFDFFSKWAGILLQDFNEIDRHLVDENSIFDYLGAIKETEHWSLNPNKSEFVENYLSFWTNLKNYYKTYTDDLLSTGIGYQGLIYKQAVEHVETYIELNQEQQH